MSLLAAAMATWAADPAGAMLPVCAGEPEPEPAPLGQPANFTVLSGGEAQTWRPPACLGWPDIDADVVVAVAGSVQARGVEELLGRLGDVDGLARVRVWSISGQEWKPMFDVARALSSPDPDAVRASFDAAEFRVGEPLYLLVDDSDPLGSFVYEVDTIERGEDGFVLELVNATAAKVMGFNAVPVGGLRTRIHAERAAEEGVWHLYVLSRSVSNAPGWLLPGEGSFVNRTAAIWRYAAGEDSDAAPPLAPG